MQNYVFQIDGNQQPLDLIHPARARELQSKGKAATYRTYPSVVIRDVAISSPNTKQYMLKIDPGSKWTEFAIQCGVDIVFPMELQNRGSLIREALIKRAGFGRGRRYRHLSYRKKRFHRSQPEGWLAPSLRHRLETVETWIKGFLRWCNIAAIEIEQVRFDFGWDLYRQS